MKKTIIIFLIVFTSILSNAQGKLERYSCKTPSVTITKMYLLYNGYNYEWRARYAVNTFNCRCIRSGIVAGDYNPTVDFNYIGNFVSENTGNSLSIKIDMPSKGAGPNQVPFYARSYVVTDEGTFYSDNLYFSVDSNSPSLSTTAVSSIGTRDAYSGGSITSEGSSPITAKGVVVGYDSSVSLSNSIVTTSDGVGTASYASHITGLFQGTNYYVRAYATNSIGTGYGDAIAFTTQQSITFPTVTTTQITSISETTAYSGGTVTYSGGGSIILKGVCWNTYGSPNTNNAKTNDGTGTAPFTSFIENLSPNTTFYVRAYATAQGVVNGFIVSPTGYGEERVFTTTGGGGVLATVTTTSVTNITTNSALSGGNVTSEGSSPVTAKGVQWSTNNDFSTILGSTSNGSGLGAFSSSITGLSQGTNYFVRAYATNSSGTSYGNVVSFTTQTPSNIIATLSSTFVSEYSNTIGVNWIVTLSSAATANVSIPIIITNGTNTGNVNYSISVTAGQLTGFIGVNYYKESSAWTAYCNFGTMPNGYTGTNSTSYAIPALEQSATLATVQTNAIISITTTTAPGGGNITSDGGSSVTARGACWSTSPNPTVANSKTTNGSGTGSFTSSITGLNANTLYYVKSYATNGIGTAYGDEIIFSTGVDCNASASYPGGIGYPSSTTVTLGNTTGTSTLTYNARTLPDRYIVYFNGVVVIDTGYRGAANYNFGGTDRASFTNSLTGKRDPILDTAYPDYWNFPQDGYPLVVGGGDGSTTFSKNLAGVAEVIVKTYAPMTSTAWSFILSCPQ